MGGSLPGGATNFTALLARPARQGMEAVYREGFLFRKAGVVLYELAPESPGQPTLFCLESDPREKTLMHALGQVNSEHGRGTVRLASAGPKRPSWRMKRIPRSPRYTTQWEELPVVAA